MEFLAGAQALVLVLLSIAAFALTVYALVDALRRPTDAFPYAGKRTKTFWTVVLGVSTAVAFVFLFNSPLSIFGILSVVAAGIYLADVRPAVKTYRGGSGRGSGSPGSW